MTKDYTYAIARIKYREKFCLNQSFITNLAQAKDEKEAVRLLADKGWGDVNMTADELILNQQKELTSLMEELLGDKNEFRVFLMENDFHNLKAAVKNALYPTSGSIYLSPNTVETSLIEACIRENDFSPLPEDMAKAAKEALSYLKESGDGQGCDIIIDSALIEAQIKEAEDSNVSLFKKYANHNGAVANIKTVVRGIAAKKDKGFFEKAVCECGVLNKKELIESALQKGFEGVLEYLSKTEYGKVAQSLKVSGALFERECDNLLIKTIKPFKDEYFSIEALGAYYLGRLNEIKTVRMLLTAKLNGFEEKYITERLREMYV